MNIYTNLPDSVHFSTYTISPGEMNIRDFFDTYYYKDLYKQYKEKLTEVLKEWEQNAPQEDRMAFTFNQVADNPIFNSELSKLLYKQYIEKLTRVLEDWEQNATEDGRMAFTFNQVADNPIFNSELSREPDTALHDQLIRLFTNDKAFLSTYNELNVISYLSNNMLKHWRDLCATCTTRGNNPPDNQYLSSFFNMATKVIPKEDNITCSGKVAAHYTMFGISCQQVESYMGMDQYIDSKTERINTQGLYNLLIHSDSVNNAPQTTAERVFSDIVSINAIAIRRPNNSMANDNGITLSKIIDAVLECDGGSLLYDIYEATASDELRRKFPRHGKTEEILLRRINPLPNNICPEIKELSYRESSFLMTFKSKLQKHTIQSYNRSDYYNIIKTQVIPQLVESITTGDTEPNIRNTGHLLRPFVQQFIDFCYNLHFSIICFGQESFEFHYYTFKTYSNSERNPNDHNSHFTPQRMRATLNETPIVFIHDQGYNLIFITQKGDSSRRRITLPINVSQPPLI